MNDPPADSTVAGVEKARNTSGRSVKENTKSDTILRGVLQTPPPDSLPKKRRRMDSELSTASIMSSPQHSESSSPVKSEAGKNDSDGKYALGSRLEAKDLSSGKWYNVKVVEVDFDEREVLIHFEKWSQRFDEWIPMDSSRLREAPRKITGKASGGAYRVGETVMATWTDCRKYPAKVKTLLTGDKVEVLFFDGFSKTMKISKISKFDGDLEVAPAKPPFGATTMTKIERRERNRKISSVAELFHMKKSYKRRAKVPVADDGTSESPSADKSTELSDSKSSAEQAEVSLRETEADKSRAVTESSSRDDSSTAEVAKKPAVTPAGGARRSAGKPATDEKGKRRKRTYNRVFLDSSPAGTVREVHPARGGRRADGDPAENPDNWEPDGDEAYVVESSDGLRRSIIVADDRLPSGWEKHTIQRRSGNSAGKWDVFLVSPTGRRFRSRKEMSAYFAETKELYEPHLYDFTLRGLSHRPLKNRKSSPATATSSETESSKVDAPTETPQRRVKTLMPKSASRAPAKPSPEKMPVPDEGKVYVGKMQVEVDTDGGFICPKEGCLKHFRKENLLQMHIKYYHPEYNKLMGSTPNVADLAYARTVGEPIEDIVPPGFFETPPNRKSAPPPASVASPPVATPPQRKEDAVQGMETKKVLKVQASSILQDAVKDPNSVASAATPPVKVPTSSPLRDLLSERPVTTGIKTLLPVVRHGPSHPQSESAEDWRGSGKSKVRKRRLSDAYMESLKRKRLAKRPVEVLNNEGRTIAVATSSDETPGFVRPHKRLPLLAASLARPPLALQPSPDPVEAAVPELSVEQLNKRDIINCTCGAMEEDGLMIQCDLCLCWQHGYCNAIESERQVPEKYVCSICLRPARARASMRHRHDQTWLKEGTLPTVAALHSAETQENAQRAQLLRKSHTVTGELLSVKAVLHSLRAKVNIADAPDHPKLYLWAKPWTKNTLEGDEKQEEKEVKQEPTLVESTTSEEKPEEAAGGTKLLLQALTAPSTASAPLDEKQLLELPICQSELLRFASSMADNLDQPPAPAAPEPEKPIDAGECRSTLLDHIEHDQRQLALTLSRLDKQIAELEAEDPEPPPQEAVDFCPRMKHTLRMLLRDLNTMRNIATL